MTLISQHQPLRLLSSDWSKGWLSERHDEKQKLKPNTKQEISVETNVDLGETVDSVAHTCGCPRPLILGQRGEALHSAGNDLAKGGRRGTVTALNSKSTIAYSAKDEQHQHQPLQLLQTGGVISRGFFSFSLFSISKAICKGEGSACLSMMVDERAKGRGRMVG